MPPLSECVDRVVRGLVDDKTTYCKLLLTSLRLGTAGYTTIPRPQVGMTHLPSTFLSRAALKRENVLLGRLTAPV